ncbi:MAG: hypothetical protein WEB52_14070 [Dehalococcoidia bacterium]
MNPALEFGELKPGDRIETVDGSIAEVIASTEDGTWIRVRYLESPGNPSLVGTEDLCSEDDLRIAKA